MATRKSLPVSAAGWQFGRYVVSGGLATAVHMAVLAGLVELGGASATLASAIGFCAALAVNYPLQYYWIFAKPGLQLKRFSRYLLVTLVMLGINTCVFWVLHARCALPYLLAQLIATCLVLVLNYCVNRFYTFSQTA